MRQWSSDLGLDLCTYSFQIPTQTEETVQYSQERNKMMEKTLPRALWNYHITSMLSTSSQSLDSLDSELRALTCSDPACFTLTGLISLTESEEPLLN